MKKRMICFIAVSAVLWTAVVVGQNENNNSGAQKKTGLSFVARKTVTKTNPDGTFIKRYYDGVNAYTYDRDADLQANVAMYDSRLGETRFFGSAAFRDSTRHLNADTLIYYDDSEDVIAIGHVMALEDDRTFWADYATYQKNNNLFHAIGNVLIRDDSLSASITGMETVFNDSTRYGIVTGYPVLIKEDEEGSIMTVTCDDTLEVVKKQNIIRLWNNVVFTQDSLRVFAGRTVYNDSLEIITMYEQPRVLNVMYEKHGAVTTKLRAESTVAGDTIRIYFKDREVTAIDVIGSAESTTAWTDSIGSVYARNILESRDMNLDMKGDEITLITASGNATSYYFRGESEEENMFLNEATGDTLHFFYTDGRISQLRISGFGGGGAKGKYYEYEPADSTMTEETAVSDLEN